MTDTGKSVARPIETKSQSHFMALVASALLFAVASAAATAGELTRSRYLMGTSCAISSSDANAIETSFREISRVESFLSTWRPESELSHYNRAPEPRSVSGELASILRQANEWSRETNGAFSPTLGRLVELWQLRGEGRVPSDAEIDAARNAPRQHVEEGAFGKGYAIDRALAVHEADRVAIDFGGQIAIRGFAAEVEIAHPESRDRGAIAIALRDASVSTTSGSERRFRAGNRTFSHILDSRTGQALPPNGSASVIHERAFVADILSTALYVMGPRDGIAWANERGIAAIFLVPDTESGNYSVYRSNAARRADLALRAIDEHFEMRD